MVTTDLLAAYRVPTSALDGVLLALPQAPAVAFKVRLPSRHNRAYQAALQAAIGKAASLDEKGEVKLDATKLASLADDRLAAFVSHCIDESSLPTGITLDALLGVYRPAADALYTQALVLSDTEEAEAAAAVGKSSASLAGLAHGKGGKPSTNGSTKQAGSSQPTAALT